MSNCLMLASFGSTFQDAYLRAVGPIIQACSYRYPDWMVAEAITSRIVKHRLATRQNLDVPNELQVAAEFSLKPEGRRLIQPLHLIPGLEYEKLLLPGYEVGTPLLSNADDLTLFAREVHFGLAPDEPLLLMGHGSEHRSDGIYAALEEAFRLSGRPNTFVATVEGSRDLPAALADLRSRGIRHLTLRPLLLIAGDHTVHDMIGNDDSWLHRLEQEGFSVQAIPEGLGEREEVQSLYLRKIDQLIQETEPIQC